jgi:hypothetical protein
MSKTPAAFKEVRKVSRTAGFLSPFSSGRASRRMLLSVGIACAGLGLFYSEQNWQGSRVWKSCSNELASKGVALDWHAFIPPPVADDSQNFAMTPVLAALFDFVPGTYTPRDTKSYARAAGFGHLGELFRPSVDPVPDWTERRKIDFVLVLDLLRRRKFVSRPGNKNTASPLSNNRTETALEVFNALEEFGPILEELRVASARPKSRFNLNYAEKEHWKLAEPHLDLLRRASVLLAVRAAAELVLDRSAAAAEEVGLILSLANSIRDVPLGSSQWTRHLILGHTRQVIWEGLAEHRWSDSQLREIQQRLLQIDLVTEVQARLRLERATGEYLFNLVRGNSAVVKQWFGPGFTAWMKSFLIRWRPSGWVAEDRYYYHLRAEKVERALDPKQGTIQPKLIGVATKDPFLDLPNHALAKVLLPGLAEIVMEAARTETSIKQIIVACSLERYRLQHGELPQSLDALESPPVRDVISGEPFKYRRIDQSEFTLYSTGWNELDDGGMTATNSVSKTVDWTRGDWVCPAY